MPVFYSFERMSRHKQARNFLFVVTKLYYFIIIGPIGELQLKFVKKQRFSSVIAPTNFFYRFFSTSISHITLTPGWIVGFVEGDGCFAVGVHNKSTMKFLKYMKPSIKVGQHTLDVRLLYALRKYFNCGQVRYNVKNYYLWEVESQNDLLNIIVPFFDQFKLQGKRSIEFLRQREILLKLEKKKHYERRGFDEIVELAQNLRINSKNYLLLQNSCHFPVVMPRLVLEPSYITGFSEAEGSFGVYPCPHFAEGKAVRIEFQPVFEVTQHKLDLKLLEGFEQYFDCGKIRQKPKAKNSSGLVYCWRVRKLSDLVEIIIPFFEKNNFYGKRSLEFSRFREIVLKLNNGIHKTPEGLREISKLAKELRVNGKNYKKKRNRY